MVIILAYAHDRAAAALAARWRAAGEDAAVLTCADLSRRGWLHVPNDPSRGRVAIDGRIVATQTIRAVIVRMPVVSEVELAHLHPGDRSYAASEMQAFLLSWLSSLLCSVINRPTTCNLGGPAWHTSEWVLRAARVGLAVRPLAWSSTATTACSAAASRRAPTAPS